MWNLNDPITFMKDKAAKISVHAWASDGILLERYAYAGGLVEPLAKHSHEEYQFGLSFNCQGQYSIIRKQPGKIEQEMVRSD